ncbi:unnamed protein product [Schistosoma margrebowiei]|uniref:GAR domain-containing protein n=1 Tax=Schistosoma margrebowiei TaxID=48269 RepID=A0A3P7WR63_9TREM|nr:unnamed protein product [Schistosoma margrebowiei]
MRFQLLSQQQSEHALIHDLIEFECEEQWVDEQTLQLNELLTIDETIFQNLSKQIIPIDLIGSTVEQDTQVLANINCSNSSDSLVLDSECDHVIHNTSSCELKECVSNSLNHDDHEEDDNVADDHDCVIDGSVDEGICKDLEVRITFAKENFEAIKNREQKICDCINAYRNLCEIIIDNGNSSINNLPSIDVTEQYSPKKELVNENYHNDYSYESFTTDSDQDNCDRANKLKTSYYNLLNRSSQRIKQLECYHKKLLEHNLLVHFNFDLWKQGYLQWIASRHYRLSDIFNPKALSTLRTDRQLSNISTNTDEVNSDLFKCPTRLSNVSKNSQSVYTSSNNIKPQLSNNRSSLIRSSIESLQPLSDNKHKQNVSHKPDEVNCSQFIQAVLHGRPTHDWANPIFIKSAFYTIDQAKKGIVTCHQIIEALSPKKQHKPLPTDKLIEHAIEQETSKCICQPKFQPRKIGKDRYCFGSSSRVYLVRFLNSTTIVRVGGGWMSLNEFLDSRDPCRITHKTSHFGITPIKANLMNTNSISKRESNLGLINVTPINKSRLTTLNNMNSKEQRSFVSTPLTNKDCDMKSLNSSYENEASIHNNSSLLKQTVPSLFCIMQLDQSLQCLRFQLLSQQQSEHALIHDLIEFECEEQWVDEQTLQLNELLTIDETIFQNLSKQIILIDLIGSTVEQDTQVLANINCSNSSTSLVLDSECDHVIHNTSRCELKECVSNSLNHDNHEEDDDNVADDHDCVIGGSVDEGICKDLEVRITFAKISNRCPLLPISIYSQVDLQILWLFNLIASQNGNIHNRTLVQII